MLGIDSVDMVASETVSSDRQLLRRLDLNLLLALDALMAECSVTRAAERLAVGQPAMSASLSRLRAFFHDPLLVRQGRQMVPTTRALMLAEPIREALNQIEATLRAGHEFDPSVSRRTFRLMASDYLLIVMLGPLLVELSDEAPNVRFEVLPPSHGFGQAVERSQIDLLLYPDELVGDEPQLHSAPLFTDRLVCAVARDHPDLGDEMTKEQFRTLPCVSFGSGPTDTITGLRFRELGIERPIEIVAQSFVVQPLLLPGTRLMTPIPERLGRHLAEKIGVRLVELPVSVEPLREAMFWSPRADADPAHQWLRDRVAQAAQALD